MQGPALGLAVAVAAQLHASLPADVLRSLLRHADPDIRANACRCACRRPELIAVMIDLLDDLNEAVVRSAACALGQMGRIEARPMLAGLLREEPSEEVIDAVSPVADEECMVLLGRIARSKPALSDAATQRVREYRPPPRHRDCGSDSGTGLGHDARRQPMKGVQYRENQKSLHDYSCSSRLIVSISSASAPSLPTRLSILRTACSTVV